MRALDTIQSPAQRARRAGEAPGRPARLLARARNVALDRRLAAGVVPWSSPVHAARSLPLTGRRRREQSARTLERLLRDAETRRRPFSAAVVPCRAQVREALPSLLALAARLRDADPVSARGMAALGILLTGGCGPCYVPTHPSALTVALDRIGEDLDTLRSR